MKRRNFLFMFITTILVWIASRIPSMGRTYGAVFRVTKVDPECSGADYHGHEGSIVYNGKRCCKNCTLVNANFQAGVEDGNGPQFGPGELTPLNQEARLLMQQCIDNNRSYRRSKTEFDLAG